MQQKNKTTFISILTTAFFISGCSAQIADNSNSTPPETAETDLCSTNTTYSSFSTLNGTATFSKRGLSVQTASNQVQRFTLGSIVSGLPIRYAEIRVINSSGAIVQCGQTNGSGLLKATDGVSDLHIPGTAESYTVEILSRSNHSFNVPPGKISFTALFSVKEDIYSNAVYKIKAQVTTTGANTYNNINANATADEAVSSKIEGGAFNIYNDIITSYEYLSNNTGVQDITCMSPKMSVYWKAGFNPNQYIYPNNDPASLGTVSYYLRGDKELYINGGILGDVATVDTDHFDDSVIIHELGHHVENSCGTMDSPGGSHNGNARIDERLAWSEGWGNFFGAHIIKNNLNLINPNLSASIPNGEWIYYFDSEGYTDGAINSGYEYIRFNLARIGSSDTNEPLHQSTGIGTASFDLVYPSLFPGESHVREVSISRGLFKATNSCSSPFANCVNQNNFSDIWKAFEKNSTGMGQSIYPFRSSIRFLERFKAVKGGSLSSALNSLFTTDEALQLAGSPDYLTGGYTTWVPYGIKLVPSGLPCNLKIKPKSNSSFKSDQRFSNHFYYVDKNNLPGVTNIKLTAAYVSGTTNVDVDLLLLSEDYRYNEDCTSQGCTKSSSTYAMSLDRSSAYPKKYIYWKPNIIIKSYS